LRIVGAQNEKRVAMRKDRRPVLVAMALGVVFLESNCRNVDSLPNSNDELEDGFSDSDADNDADTDVDMDTGTETGTDNEGDAGGNSEWCDPETGLCWQNPSSEELFVWNEAVMYCESLSLGGHGDWRLPMVQELISLIRGCVGGNATGDLSTSECGVTDPGCLEIICDDSDCAFCNSQEGPDDEPSGCYWYPDLSGYCFSSWYWSSSSQVDIEGDAWVVHFGSGNVLYFDKISNNAVRCVRY